MTAPRRMATRTDETAAVPSAHVAEVVTAAYDEYQRELFSFAIRTARDSGAAEDSVQEAFLRLTREVTAGRTPDNIRAWLFRVVANVMASRGRRTRVADRLRHLFVSRDVAEAPEVAFLRHERDLALEAELGRLSHDARVGLLMAAQGFSMREIGEAVGRSEGATRAMVCRARVALRRGLESSGVVDGRP
jgi:RNA polymerase sigma-70 factor (ECF subfamily)